MSIRNIFEVEEPRDSKSPKELLGKFFAAALADYYDPGDPKERDGDIYIMNQSVKFIQVINIDALKNRDDKKSRNKMIQWKALEKSINSMLPIGKIQEYKMFLGYTSQFEEGAEKWNDIVHYVETDITEAFGQYQW